MNNNRQHVKSTRLGYVAIIPQLTIQYTVQPAEMFLQDNVSRVALFVGNKSNQCASLLEDLKCICNYCYYYRLT